MRRCFLGNYDFEHQLVSDVYGGSRGATPALNASLASSWIGLAEDGDQIFLPGTIPAEFVSRLIEAGLPRVEFTHTWPDRKQAAAMELIPWGWSGAVSQLAANKGFQCDAPDLDSVQAVNARKFSFECERKWEIALAGSAHVESLAELETALIDLQKRQGRLDNAWVVKANFSMSARERMRGHGAELSSPIKGWAEKRFSQGQTLFLEPWVNRRAEAGLQFEIPQQGSPELIGMALLLSDERGQYRGSCIAVDQNTRQAWQPAIEVGQRVATRAQQVGYFGPLGIDAMMFADEQGETQIRSVQDVNARYTMGRVALGFSRFLEPDQVASWLHFPWKESYGIRFSNWLRCVSEQENIKTRLIATSPDEIDGQTLRLVNVLLISESAEQLCQAEASLMRKLSELTESAG